MHDCVLSFHVVLLCSSAAIGSRATQQHNMKTLRAAVGSEESWSLAKKVWQ